MVITAVNIRWRIRAKSSGLAFLCRIVHDLTRESFSRYIRAYVLLNQGIDPMSRLFLVIDASVGYVTRTTIYY
jgi:hypothetical protein